MNQIPPIFHTAFDHLMSDEGGGALQTPWLFEQLWTAPKAALISWLISKGHRRIVLISATARTQGALQLELPFFTASTILTFPHAEDAPVGQELDIALTGQRMKTLAGLLNLEGPQILLTELAALLQPTLSPTALMLKRLQLRPQLSYSPKKLAEQLLAMGYVKTHLAVEKGQFAPRSGLLDILPPGEAHGFRIDFWGDEIEAIRTFDPGSQRSQRSVDELEILPAREVMSLDERGNLLDYIDEWGEPPALILDDLAALESQHIELFGSEQKAHFDKGIGKLLSGKGPKVYLLTSPLRDLSETHLVKAPAAKGRACQLQFSFFNTPMRALCPSSPFQSLTARFGPLGKSAQSSLIEAIGCALDEDFRIIIASANEADRAFIEQKLQNGEIDTAACIFVDGYLANGFVLERSRIALISTVQLTGHITLHRPQVTSGYRDPLDDDSGLEMGSLVVHQQNGVGLFRGVEQRQNHLGDLAEFLKIEYADRAQLYVPLQQAHLIDKYISTKEESPRLHTLGSSRWKTLRAQTEEAIGGYAESLLKMDAERALKQSFGYPEDSLQVQRFEGAFPYSLTEDQAKAVDMIKADLASHKLMDRLICGDVGYGKTEVAMRAAFKTVVDGKQQVVLLVPTTVLALQHFETFKERMSSFSLRIAQLSRFISNKESRQILLDLAAGHIDIVIGTHRVLSKDIAFHNLGMVIIDEEQRFGVRAKEHLRSFRSKAHCLTLSATPIPRTLYLSLMGTRELSVINTPPRDRQHVATIIAPASDELIQAALLRELHRQGQIFVIHNRVESLPLWQERLQRLIPQARIAMAHGQMNAESIDSVFHSFKSGEADILLATSIVENGIDIPNANTLIVDRSDAFGLSDLHQLRGRVGRWNRKAFAYFLYPPSRVLPEVSAKRLRALQETSGPAGGMKIAMRDLQIRGCGQILGMQQSGHVSSIGFHLYCKLLKRTLETMRGHRPPALGDVRIELIKEGKIASDYVDDVSLRMHLYRRIGDSDSEQEIENLEIELIDRFGKPPAALQQLLMTARLRCFAAEKGIASVKLSSLATSEKMGQLQLEKKTERKTLFHRVALMINCDERALEKKIKEEIDNFSSLDQKARSDRVLKHLKSSPLLTKFRQTTP